MGIVDEFFDLKESTDADLLAMQVGDFYEFFADDANIVSNELGLKVSEKSSHGSSYNMAGVPIKDLEQYVKTLVENKGYTIAIADQYEEDSTHKREIVRKVTPGTILESVKGESEYLASVVVQGDSIGLAFTDINSGKIFLKQSSKEQYLNDISVYRPAEILISSTDISVEECESIAEEISNYMNTRIEMYEQSSNPSNLVKTVRNQFGSDILESISVEKTNQGVLSAGIIINYLDDSIPQIKNSVTSLRKEGEKDSVQMDARTRQSLELVDTISSETGESLLDVLDNTVTENGKDRLRRYIQRPLCSIEGIESRQESVSGFVTSALTRRKVKKKLQSFPNLQKIASKASYGNAKPREIAKIINGIEATRELKKCILNDQTLCSTEVGSTLRDIDEDKIKSLEVMIDSALVDDPPNSVDSRIIAEGYNENLDEVLEEYQENKNWFDNLEEQIKNKYNLTHVTVDRNKTDGYYVQVGKSEADEIPRERFEEIKQLKNSKRFKNEEMRKRERKFLRLEEKKEDLEEEVFDKLLAKVSQYSSLLQSIGGTISHVDAILSLAIHAIQNNWTKPSITNSQSINVQGGRHPVVEQNVDFVSNDTLLSRDKSFLIVTGPNMAGKSTYLRQTALIVLLAQVGSYIPATNAEIGIRDAIFTRVGAMDEISRGRSTFMVEMAELANILHSSTDNSLIILDEVGRGTATYDGISIARSTIEHLAGSQNSFQTPLTMFATHYHELTEMSNEYNKIRNVHVAVESGESKEDYKFIREVRDGPADKSYGIRVADLAGVPNPIIERSEEILSELRKDNGNHNS